MLDESSVISHQSSVPSAANCELRTENCVLPRDLAERLLAGLKASETSRGHLAQRVMHEGLGYCGWRSESPRCVEHRALVDELRAVLGER